MDNQIPLHNKHLHKFVLNKFVSYKKGAVLDLPSGPAYLLKELLLKGFTGIAGEIDKKLHVFKDIDYKQVDMCKTFPFEDGTFDYVISVEGIEHIENHFTFISEVKRVLKKNGVFVMTTPNIHSLESRIGFFFSGFHSLQSVPIPLDTDNIYFEHINPVSFDMLYFICEREGLKIEKLETSKYRKGSLFLYYLLYPLIYFCVRKSCFKDKRLFKFLISKNNQAGGHTIITAKKL